VHGDHRDGAGVEVAGDPVAGLVFAEQHGAFGHRLGCHTCLLVEGVGGNCYQGGTSGGYPEQVILANAAIHAAGCGAPSVADGAPAEQ
jgi:hypothetical protein